jgi:hypothetical protein
MCGCLDIPGLTTASMTMVQRSLDGCFEILDRLDIKPCPITVKNPRSNAICERMHQTVANVLRVLLHAHPPQNVADADQLVDNSLATAVHVTRCAVSR